MVVFNEFFSKFKEFGNCQVAIFIKKNPHPTNMEAFATDEMVDYSQVSSNGATGAKIDDVILTTADIVTYNSYLDNQKIESLQEYKNRHDIEFCIDSQDYRQDMVNGECQMLLYNSHNAKCELFAITRSFTQPSVESSILLWGVFLRSCSDEDIDKLEKETECELYSWILSYA